MTVSAFRWKGEALEVLDQRRLPNQIEFFSCRTPQEVADSIRIMAVRGAPAIGCCAAYGMVLAGQRLRSSAPLNELRDAAHLLKSARPTAVNLAWAVDRMMTAAQGAVAGGRSVAKDLEAEAGVIEKEDIAVNQSLGRWGAGLFKKNTVILTHCNAGSLATAGYGTALGVIRGLFTQKKLKKVFVDETRPYLQGARLTAWELAQEGIPHELITDSMAAHFMKTEKVSGVIVGCDRVAANGDTANKIGTYGVAVAARYHKIPFYVAMPFSTFDPKISSGAKIPIEQRSEKEVLEIFGQRLAPEETSARHPAFDVTPAELITAFITERGVVRAPFKKNLAKFHKLTASR